MNYTDGKEVQLGDLIEIDMPKGLELARVVMLGENYQHLELEQSFKEWVLKEQILETNSIVIEWVGKNPLEHNNPEYAPVGNYMFTGISTDIKLRERA
ncbi:MAG: hypothetical protein JAZ17_01895 [Candidatus Thiodiazotropha endolucinida]|uniref:Uncharacterized protein n=1 Tax=Candidatus Thiodiazotropha taylori TaxID=2792791 RepID=A0A9E4N703_9GAMM|nr:hypothetical protein [Candidatus Thiodiazotropha taylori]MCG8092375.1 hypothetical protein [Candidatus Thiodiazotropha endolucinida]MCW4258837.1 hypothetical protein [Candidatus Thiodiazotropha taylori]